MGITVEGIHGIAESLGFWDPAKRDPHFTGWTVRDHLLHALAEVDEWLESDEISEAADVCIILLDLLGAHGVRGSLNDIVGDLVGNEYWRILARAYDTYRKTGNLDKRGLFSIVADLFNYYGEIAMTEAIEAKCAKNQTRGELYGVSK